jgi:hypothetical protein
MTIANAVDAETLCRAVVDAGLPTLNITLVDFDFDDSWGGREEEEDEEEEGIGGQRGEGVMGGRKE